LKKYAEAVGLDIAKFEGCLSGGVLKAAVRRHIDDGNRLGVTGTQLSSSPVRFRRIAQRFRVEKSSRALLLSSSRKFVLSRA
jgi:hypothetical protein